MRPEHIDRLDAAHDAVGAYLRAGHGDPDSFEDTLTDLITDLLHLATDDYGIDPAACIERAQRRHSFERQENAR